MGSFVPTAGSVERQWHVIDAEGQVLGRIATEAARLLQGKHKAVYTPHIDTGDHVVVVNAAKVRLTGRKDEQKVYRYHSGYEGGLRVGARQGPSSEEPVSDRGRGGSRDAPQDQARRSHVAQAQGVCRREASSSGAEAHRPEGVRQVITRNKRVSARSHNVAAGIEYYGTGRRKTSTARVFLRPGAGGITVNRKPIEQAFPTEALRTQIKQPLAVTETGDKFDVLATIAGGGIAGQAGALRLGIARALVEYNVELRQRLKKAGFLTRDARIKERKKYGQKGARKRFQFSKR